MLAPRDCQEDSPSWSDEADSKDNPILLPPWFQICERDAQNSVTPELFYDYDNLKQIRSCKVTKKEDAASRHGPFLMDLTSVGRTSESLRACDHAQTNAGCQPIEPRML